MTLIRSQLCSGHVPQDHKSQVRKGILISRKKTGSFQNVPQYHSLRTVLCDHVDFFLNFFFLLKSGGDYLLKTGFPMHVVDNFLWLHSLE